MTNKVVGMNGMFYGCKSLSNLNISNFDTANVENMSNMFHSCSSLRQLNLLHFEYRKCK